MYLPNKFSIFKSLLILGLLFIVTCSFAQVDWDIIGPGCGGDLLTCAIQPDNSDIIYIGGDIEGAFKTSDGGQSWDMINFGLNGGDRAAGTYGIQELVISPVDFNTVYACTWAGLYVSSEAGYNWELIYPDVLDEEGPMVSYMCCDPQDPDILFMGIGNTAEEEDGAGELYRSTDGGSTWELLDTGMSDESIVHSVEIDPSSPSDNRIVYMATDDGVLKSSDFGDTWSAINNGLPHMDARRLKVHGSGAAMTLFLSMKTGGDPGTPSSWEGGLYKSSDGGANWVEINGDIPQYDVDGEALYDYRKFDVHPTNADIIYMGTYYSDAYSDMGIYKTTDGGDSWFKTDDDNITFGWLDDVWWDDLNVAYLQIAPSNPDIVYTGKDYPQRTTNAGTTWEQIYTDNIDGAWSTRGIELMLPLDFGFDPTDENILYVGYDDMGIWRSDDAGVSFVLLDDVQDPDEYDAATSIAIDPVNGDVYLGRNSGTNDELVEYTLGTVMKSTNQGADFTYINSGLPAGCPDVVLDPDSPTDNRTLYCSVYGSGVYKSTDGGSSWSAANTGLGDDASLAWTLEMNPSNSSELYVGLNTLYGTGLGGVYKTSNGGDSWTRLTGLPENDVLSIAIDPSNSSTVYVGSTDSYEWSEEGGLYRSTNGGDSWESILTQPRVSAVVVHPENPDVIFAASQSWWNHIPDEEYGCYRTMDGGDTWEVINFDLGHTYILSAAINPHSPNQLFVGTHGGGVWTTSNSVASVENEETVPQDYTLVSNYPNPFNSKTSIRFSLTQSERVQLTIYNLLGEKIIDLADEVMVAGSHKVVFDASHLAGGIYFCTLRTVNSTSSTKIVYLK
jgi:photosystem II stability/assembly factor-like uncharacterized protein